MIDTVQSVVSDAGDLHFVASVLATIAARLLTRNRPQVVVIGTGGQWIGWPEGVPKPKGASCSTS